MATSLLLAAVLAIAPASFASVPSPAEAELQLRVINHRFADAYRLSDPAYIDALTDRDFLLVDVDGAWLERDAFLAAVRKPAPFADIAYDAVQVRLFGEVAVVHGVFHGRTGAGETAQVRYTDVYAWRDGRWRLVGAQNTPIRGTVQAAPTHIPAPANGRPWTGEDPRGDDIAVLIALNQQYVQAFRDAVVQERAWELAFEGDRLFDLRRTNTIEKVLVQKYGKTITSGAYFFPVPQREIDTNPLMK